MKFSQIIYICFLAVAITACVKPLPETVEEAPATEQSDKPVLRISADEIADSSEGVDLAEDGITLSGDDAWAAFPLDVTAAGRYQVRVFAKAAAEGASIWIEDYVGNKDERTYNITGEMPVAVGADFVATTKDGSPLNTGIHPMKIHVKGGPVTIDRIELELMIPHQNTPEVLTQNMEGDEWVVVWSDEFDGTGSVDTSKWTFDVGDWGWGNNELQYYTDQRAKNARVEDGNLIIQAHQNDDGQEWTSARLTTRGKTTFKYGRIEFRAKTPSKRGTWAAGWTLGDAYVDELSWPYCGEIDIMESVGYEMDDESGDGKAHASVHTRAYYFKIDNHRTSTLDVKSMEDDYHLYAVEWTPDAVTAFVDDTEYFSYAEKTPDTAWPFDDPQNIILNLAIGGGWGGAKGMDPDMGSPKIIIDYVRVYAKQ